MQNNRLNEAQAGIQIAGRNIYNLRYADDTTLMAESKEELNSLLMKEKEESEKAGLKLNIQKTKITSILYHASNLDRMLGDKLWIILQGMGIPDHLTCLLRNLYAGQEATVRTRHGTTD